MAVCWHSHPNSVIHGSLLTFPWASKVVASRGICWLCHSFVDAKDHTVPEESTRSWKEEKQNWRWVILHDSWLVRPVQCPVHVPASCSSYCYSFSRQADYAAVCSKAIRLPRAACPSQQRLAGSEHLCIECLVWPDSSRFRVGFLTSAETIRLIRDGEPKRPPTCTQLLSSEPGTIYIMYVLTCIYIHTHISWRFLW